VKAEAHVNTSHLLLPFLMPGHLMSRHSGLKLQCNVRESQQEAHINVHGLMDVKLSVSKGIVD